MVETLVEATRTGTAPFQRYARLRKKLLGLRDYHLYDAFVPIYRSDKAYPYEMARELAMQSVAPLGEDYVEQYRRVRRPAAGSTSTRTKASAAAPTAPACTASARTC